MSLLASSARGLLRTFVRNMENNAAKSALTVDIDSRAADLYRSHEQSFYQMPVDKIDFVVSTNETTKKAEPKIVFSNEPVRGLLHLTPIASTRFAFFSETGTLGRKIVINGNTIETDDLAKATLDIALGAAPLHGQAEQNPALLEYTEWLDAIADKLASHLAANVNVYTQIPKRINGFSAMSPDVQLKLIKSNIRTPYRALPPPVAADKSEQQLLRDRYVVAFKNRIYRQAADKSKIAVRCPSDETMKERGFVRLHVPVFDHLGNEVPVTSARISSGDIVTIQNVLRPMMMEVGPSIYLGLKADMRSVVLLRARDRRRSAVASPFVPQ